MASNFAVMAESPTLLDMEHSSWHISVVRGLRVRKSHDGWSVALLLMTKLGSELLELGGAEFQLNCTLAAVPIPDQLDWLDWLDWWCCPGLRWENTQSNALVIRKRAPCDY